MEDDFVTITIWVNDMLLFATTIKLKNKAITDVESEWKITDLGMPTKIVSIKLAISADVISISLSSYINSILAKEGLDQCNAVTTPLDPHIILVPNLEGNIGN